MKLLKLLFIIICLASLVIGCSSRSSNEINVDGDQQLTIMIGQVNDPLSKEVVQILREVIIQFESNHPGAKVSLDTLTTQGNFDDKLLSTSTDEKPPNIVVVQPNKFIKYANKGILADLTAYANMDNLPMSDIYQPLLSSASIDNTWLTVPFAPNPYVVYYNKAWFDQANLTYPDANWTWEDFAETAYLLKNSRSSSEVNQYGGIYAFNLFAMEPLLLSRGGSILSPDGKHASGFFDSDESVSAVKFLIDFYKQQKLDQDKYKPVDTGNLANYFIRGDAGMIVAESTALYYFEPELKNNLGVASLPSFRGGIKANPLVSLGLSIVEQSDDKVLAWEFIKMMSLENNDFTQQWSQWFLVNNAPLAAATGQDTDAHKNVMLEELNYIHPAAWAMNEYFIRIYDDSGMKMGMMLSDLMTKEGDSEIKEQLTLIAQTIDEIIAKSEAAANISD